MNKCSHTATGATARRRLRLAGLVALPVLVFSTACGGDGDGDGGGAKDAGVASVPDESGAQGQGKGEDESKEKGEADGKGAGKGAFYDAQLEYVQCMRSKAGLKDYPDPLLSGYLDWPKIDELVDPDGGGEEYKGGKDGVCAPELRAAMNLEPERDAQKDYESMLAHATCMRENGMTKFANPTMSGGNVMPGGEPNPTDPSMDRRSPAYKAAREACKDKLLEGLDGMQ
ncbi:MULTISPECIES: hypothetical protein [Streptomyces]|uniref:Lipoprotein n=1 Tax=Streptomyces venezuelae TaxID=54571 RepID=A0A5P2BDH3_STRVZ|nr:MULTISPECIES: hypothetical protein [Streptomyces]NDZ98346.1 hypothetical protein [Streptomyces sp. SID10116]MYY87253.1 hypothetical protein [Streptomyces sp. SID335]MYZ13915.1 hypothetical protein [Streptomyces sp. SID337]NDZ87240.1 hypothetical protein [Streptomyces sp. SID10115]NEB48301.1 hypothetical protein [Streptomyces sp. SID339]